MSVIPGLDVSGGSGIWDHPLLHSSKLSETSQINKQINKNKINKNIRPSDGLGRLRHLLPSLRVWVWSWAIQNERTNSEKLSSNLHKHTTESEFLNKLSKCDKTNKNYQNKINKPKIKSKRYTDLLISGNIQQRLCMYDVYCVCLCDRDCSHWCVSVWRPAIDIRIIFLNHFSTLLFFRHAL